MKALALAIAAVLAACVVDGHDAPSPPVLPGGTGHPTSTPPSIHPHTPACEPCNGPGCEELDAACAEVDSDAIGLMCDPGAPLDVDDFTTIDARGRTVACRPVSP